jgi:apolipoprotein N-acyltransferase
VLLLANEAVAAALTRGRARAQLWAGAGALAGFALLLGYGALRLHQLQPQLSEPAPALRVGLVQSGIVDYERRRAEVGAYAVVREVLDTHFAMSMDAVQGQGAQALLWSETVYPTPFGHPRSADGAELDRELLDFVEHAGVPLLFGTYDVDAAGEYNAAALLEPEQGLIGYYRKTRPFPLTEYVPAWLDHARLRRWLPWAGTWRPGDGVRVLPLRSAGGPEINFVPLICLDAVDPRLAIEGARLGAQAILSLSNDAWFSAAPQGAHLHLAVASFRSIETRLPQLRVTSNGMSAVIDETGEVLVATSMGSRAVLVGSIPARARAPTLMVRLGDWVGAAALVLLGSILLAVLWPRLRGRMGPTVSAASRPLEFELSLLSPGWRLAAAALRVCAGAGLLAVLLQMLLGEGLQVNSLRQIKLFAAAVLAPALAAWALQRAFALRARVEAGALHLAGRGRHTRVELGALTELRLWRLPLPRPGLTLVDADGRRIGLAFKDPRALLDVLAHVPGVALSESSPVARWVRARALAWRPWLDHALLKFVLFPLLPALPAFRLHQYIAFGGSLGELYTYGLGAWFGALLLWWVSWAIGMCLLAAAQRALVELTCLLGLWLRPQSQQDLRQVLEWISRAIYYLGVPAWLALRLLSG